MDIIEIMFYKIWCRSIIYTLMVMRGILTCKSFTLTVFEYLSERRSRQKPDYIESNCKKKNRKKKFPISSLMTTLIW
tara:strand:+ start:203 stop:433 length:231 start_codon:yes stop_codon:yes gene_type:complete